MSGLGLELGLDGEGYQNGSPIAEDDMVFEDDIQMVYEDSVVMSY